MRFSISRLPSNFIRDRKPRRSFVESVARVCERQLEVAFGIFRTAAIEQSHLISRAADCGRVVLRCLDQAFDRTVAIHGVVIHGVVIHGVVGHGVVGHGLDGRRLGNRRLVNRPNGAATLGEFFQTNVRLG